MDFVGRTVADDVPLEERVAVFDNDGTLWCEQPLPSQADFILRRLSEMAEADPGLRGRQPWQAAYEHDHAWLRTVLAEHYAGDDTNVRTLLGGVLAAYDGIDVDDFEARSADFLRTAQHSTLGRRYEVYGISRDRVIGSATTLTYTSNGAGGTITHNAEADYLDDGPQKPVRIWSRIGRRPMLAAGNSNGDIPMLEFAHHEDKPSLRLLIDHDDGEREFAYTTGAERSLEQAAELGWTVVSMKNDWSRVF